MDAACKLTIRINPVLPKPSWQEKENKLKVIIKLHNQFGCWPMVSGCQSEWRRIRVGWKRVVKELSNEINLNEPLL